LNTSATTFAIVLSLSLSAWSIQASAEKFYIEPGAATASDDGRLVTGTFVLKKYTAGDEPVTLPSGESGVLGGACLLYSYPADLKVCETHNDCTDHRLKQTPAGPVIETINGSCADGPFTHVPVTPPEEGTRPTGPKTCWYRASDAYCDRDPVNPRVLNKVNELPNKPLQPNLIHKPILWRVVTCQHIVFGGCITTEDGIKKRTRYGPWTLFAN
jgi:hypothetical protein